MILKSLFNQSLTHPILPKNEWMNEWMVFQATILYCKALLGWEQPGLMSWILVWAMPQVQNRSLDLLTCSPMCYHSATAIPLPQTTKYNLTYPSIHPSWPKTQITKLPLLVSVCSPLKDIGNFLGTTLIPPQHPSITITLPQTPTYFAPYNQTYPNNYPSRPQTHRLWNYGSSSFLLYGSLWTILSIIFVVIVAAEIIYIILPPPSPHKPPPILITIPSENPRQFSASFTFTATRYRT